MKAADTPAQRELGVRPGRGGFLRGADDAPYVTCLSGELVKSGARKGQARRVKYGSPSGFAKLIENSYSLAKYTERYIVEGIGLDDVLQTECRNLAANGRDHEHFNRDADSIVARARSAANHMLAADRGTHMHAVTDDIDEGRDWLERAEAGELLGISREAQTGLVDAWREMMAATGFEVLAVEAACIDDTWRLAGTLDRIVRTTKPLRFVIEGGVFVDVPANTVCVLDTKTGHPRRQGYAVQIASYAQSRPYDTAAETRGEWPWPIDQNHALIAHLDVIGAINGNPSWELIYVDLIAGREHGGATVVAAKAWEQRKDIFSVAQLDAEATEIAVSAPAASPAPLRAGPGTPPTTAGADTALIVPPETCLPPCSPVAEPSDVPGAAAPVEHQTAVEGATHAPSTAPLSPLRQAQAERVRIDAEADAKQRLHITPEEGDMSTTTTFAAVQSRYARLDAAGQAWVKQVSVEAEAAGVGISAKHTKSVRRFGILVALVQLAADEIADDDVRKLLSLVIGDVALFAGVPLGHLVGSLNATEADTFAGLATGRLGATFDASGRPVVTEVAA